MQELLFLGNGSSQQQSYEEHCFVSQRIYFYTPLNQTQISGVQTDPKLESRREICPKDSEGSCTKTCLCGGK